MAIELGGKTIEITDSGHLVNAEDWSEEVANYLAEQDGVTLTEKHWDIINYLRDEYFNNAGNQPNERTIVKDIGKKWGTKISSKDTFDLFPHMPSKQGGKIAGLPESRRKGGY